MNVSFNDFLLLTDRARPFLAPGGRAYAAIPAAFPGHLTLPLRSRAFRQWFFDLAFTSLNSIPSPQSFAAILHHLDAQAARDPQTCNIRVPFRVDARDPDKILVDLANPAGEFVEITPSGWRTTTAHDVPFETSPSSISLPPPQSAPDPAPPPALRSLLHLHDDHWLRTLAWLLAALRPSGPFPILILRGPSGAGKSYAATVLRALIDPGHCPFSPLPVNPRELLTFTRHNWVLAFDHVESLSPALASAIARVSSGIGSVLREPGQPEPLLQWIRRPILITAPDSWTPPPDLAARALTVTLPALTPADRRPTQLLNQTLELQFPYLTAALYDAVSHALANPATPTGSSTRLADTVAWAHSAFPALDFDRALDPSHAPNPLLDAVRALLAGTDTWRGTPSALHELLPFGADPRTLSKNLRDSALTLADAGIAIDFPRGSGGTRLIHLSATQPPDLYPQPKENKTPRKPPLSTTHSRLSVTTEPESNRTSKH